MKYHGIILFILAFSVLSCQSAKEVHYFKEGEQFYRLKVREHALFSSSRYMAGYFDPRAVDTYFGEITRPDSAKLSTESVCKDGEIVDNKKLVMILSTNSDVVANQISAFAENEQTLELIAKLANQSVIEDSKELANEKANLLSTVESLVSVGDQFVQRLDTLSNKEAISNLLAYLNYVAASQGRTKAFQNITEADEWYQVYNELNK